jgi:hypothetical protein
MFAIVKNNEIVKMGELKKLFPSVSFPSGGPGSKWLADNDVVEVIYNARQDERFYWVSEQQPTYNQSTKKVEVGFTSTAKILDDREESDEDGNPLYVKVFDPSANDGEGAMVDTEERLVTKGLKSQWTIQIKTTANSLLQPTDWMVIRKIERDIDIPTATATYRAAVITEAERLETAIASAEDIESFIAVVNNQQWPTK